MLSHLTLGRSPPAACKVTRSAIPLRSPRYHCDPHTHTLLSPLSTGLQPPWPLTSAWILLRCSHLSVFSVWSTFHKAATWPPAHFFKGPVQMSPCHLKCHLLISISLHSPYLFLCFIFMYGT